MTTPLLTIAIPVYNRHDIVRRTLASVAAQTYRPLKVILVDNNSTDATWLTLNEWKNDNESADLQVEVLREEQPGASAARNCALARVDTEWTMFFDSDDEMPPDHVEKAVGEALKHPDAQIIGWARRIHFLDGKSVIKRFTVKNPEYNNITQSILATQSYMARTELFRAAGGWDTSLSMGDDIELGSRLLLLRPRMAVVPGHFVEVYDSTVSITNSQKFETVVRALEKIRLTLPEGKRKWVDLQILLKAASWGKSDPEAAAFVKKVIESTPFPRLLLWKFLYGYTLKGGRGAARFYSLLHFGQMGVRD